MVAKARRRRYSSIGQSGIAFENRGKLLVPGYGVSVPTELPPNECFGHGFLDWSQNRLTAREIAMLRLMNSITDRPEWHIDFLHNPAIVATWANEALSFDPLISLATWDWCVAELLDKAALYDKSKITHVLDSASRICKSDHLISSSLLEELATEVERLPHLVDPDMFPLVYEKTRVLSGGHVGRTDAVEYAGRGSTSSSQRWRCPRHTTFKCDRPRRSTNSGRRGRGRGGLMACDRCRRAESDMPVDIPWDLRGERFSADYQWLPSEISFESSPGGSRIRLCSYINNLHPRRNSTLYRIVEECIEASILPWNEILCREKGRTPQRIRTYGVQWSPDPPRDSDLEDLVRLMRRGEGQSYHNAERRLRSFIEQPDNPLSPVRSIDRYPLLNLASDEWRKNPAGACRVKYECVKRWLHPEPGVSFTYQDWKEGRNSRAIVPSCDNRARIEDHEFYTVDLEREFAKQGLQVIVEIGGVDLTPERPSQVEADLDPVETVWGREAGSKPYHPLVPLADIFGCESYEELGTDEDDYSPGGNAIQTLGSVKTPIGRILAFPNVMQHRTESFTLLDPSAPGHNRFLKLHLVDPHYRICSTRNVPPQRYDWWYEAGLGRIDWIGHDVPPELRLEISELVKNGCGDYPIGADEAERVRRHVYHERRRKYEHVNENMAFYNFTDATGIGGKFPLPNNRPWS